MKYYCKDCKTEFLYTENYDTSSEDVSGCPICDSGYYSRVPEYETPAQYEARTEKPFPDNGLVWYQLKPKEKICRSGEWGSKSYGQAKYNKKEHYAGSFWEYFIVIASPPIPPPDDWEPEEMK